jgi:hypothetical protein
MHTREAVNEVLELAAGGLGARRISQRTGVSVRTITDWLAGRLPRSVSEVGGGGCATCGADRPHQFGDLPPAYVYLLGLYLGDGYVAPHPRGVHKLRITLDARYPGIVEEAAGAVHLITPQNSVGRLVRGDNCVEVYGYSRSWPCLLPQSGPGKKHERLIELASWQSYLVDLHPRRLLRGLIQSDGCRFQNTGRAWSNPRYKFDNKSGDIRRIFCSACELLGLRWSESGTTIYVSRKIDVARMDEFIGPKA